ncbi:MAG: hypothetical protein KKC19_00600 [Nanoarchaeota archaeon]|nr:hypothetical protein [Nanoarchaeota archaeon]
MTDGNYERIVNRIAESSGNTVANIEEKIEVKRSKLSGFISKEGAAQIVAAELGITFENEKLKIDELLPGMRKVHVVGKIVRLFPVRSFTTKKGDESKVANMWVADESSNIKVVLWDTNHISLIEDEKIKEGSVVEIVNAMMRDGELHLGNFSEIKPSSEILGEVKTERTFKEKNISEFVKGESAGTRAFIVQAFEPRFFRVCSECGKKVEPEGEGFVCKEHGKVVPEKRAIVTIVIDDGTDSIRAVLFHESVKDLGITELENPEILMNQRQDLLGKEMVFSGSVRENNYFNNLEIVVDSVKELDLDVVVKGLEEGK